MIATFAPFASAILKFFTIVNLTKPLPHFKRAYAVQAAIISILLTAINNTLTILLSEWINTRYTLAKLVYTSRPPFITFSILWENIMIINAFRTHFRWSWSGIATAKRVILHTLALLNMEVLRTSFASIQRIIHISTILYLASAFIDHIKRGAAHQTSRRRQTIATRNLALSLIKNKRLIAFRTSTIEAIGVTAYYILIAFSILSHKESISTSSTSIRNRLHTPSILDPIVILTNFALSFNWL